MSAGLARWIVALLPVACGAPDNLDARSAHFEPPRDTDEATDSAVASTARLPWHEPLGSAEQAELSDHEPEVVYREILGEQERIVDGGVAVGVQAIGDGPRNDEVLLTLELQDMAHAFALAMLAPEPVPHTDLCIEVNPVLPSSALPDEAEVEVVVYEEPVAAIGAGSPCGMAW